MGSCPCLSLHPKITSICGMFQLIISFSQGVFVPTYVTGTFVLKITPESAKTINMKPSCAKCVTVLNPHIGLDARHNTCLPCA